MKKLLFLLILLLTTTIIFAEEKLDITGIIEWDNLHLRAAVSLDLASAGIRFPFGRLQAEASLSEGFIRLIRPKIMEIRVDSSTTINDLVSRGEMSLLDIDAIALGAQVVPPALSQDMKSMVSSYSMSLASISASLLRHNYPTPVIRVLNPVSSARYTGIIIIASENLPIYGMRSSALAVPCLFPKIWDSEMNLIYERSMLESHNTPMVRYSASENIFRNNPSGLSDGLREIVGERPLRIFARGVFGINPTDLIIDRNDALLIISSEENRRLLSQGRVAVILDESVLKNTLD
jgi:hypothetical protein